MQDTYSTARLLLAPLTLGDAAFIMELVNSPGWIKFIGNRNINDLEQANAYIQKILDNPNIKYWVVSTKEKQNPIGVITFIKRDYLEHHDIGFAFLPEYTKQGYAYEAATIVLSDVMNDAGHKTVLATTIGANSNSIQLLEKMGLHFNNEITNEGETLLVYTI